MPRSPRGCCFAGPWAVGKVCRRPSWPRNTASSTVSAPAAPCFWRIPCLPPRPPRLSRPVGVGRRSVSLLVLALCRQQRPGSPSSHRSALFLAKNMAIKTLTAKNTSREAARFQSSFVPASGAVVLLGSAGHVPQPRRPPRKPQLLCNPGRLWIYFLRSRLAPLKPASACLQANNF